MNKSVLVQALGFGGAQITVEGIIAPLETIRSQLHSHAKECERRAIEKRNEALRLMDEADALESEAQRAASVQCNLGEVIL